MTKNIKVESELSIYLHEHSTLWEVQDFNIYGVGPGSHDQILVIKTKTYSFSFMILYLNTPGTRGGPGGGDRTLAVKSRKKVRKITFFS